MTRTRWTNLQLEWLEYQIFQVLEQDHPPHDRSAPAEDRFPWLEMDFRCPVISAETQYWRGVS